MTGVQTCALPISPLPQRYPTETEVAANAPSEAGESLALGERNRLGLGDAPVHNLRQLLDADLLECCFTKAQFGDSSLC